MANMTTLYSLTGIAAPVGQLYQGDMAPGDRAATPAEIAAWQAARANAVPPQVTNAQLKRQLDAQGKLASALQAATTAGGLALQLWYGAEAFHRNDPLLIQLATAIGMTSTDIDAAFVAAAKL